MSRDEYNRMLIERFHGEQRWETELAEGWTVNDLQADELSRSIDEAIRRGRMSEPGTRDPLELLRGFGLLRNNQLFRAAVVLFGRQERLEAEYPQCLLRVAKFKGTDKTEFIDNRQFSGNVFRLLNLAEQFLRESLPIAGRVVPHLFERADDPLYPHESLPWNPMMARVFHRRGIIESWGRGTIKMVELAEKAGQPRPEIEESGGCVVVRFQPGRYVAPQQIKRDLTKRQRSILQFLATKSSGLSRAEIAKALRLPLLTVRDELERLRSLEMVETYGYGRGAVWHLKNS